MRSSNRWRQARVMKRTAGGNGSPQKINGGAVGIWKMENEIWLLGERETEGQNALHLHRNSIQLRRLEDPLARGVHRRAEQQRMTTYGSGFNDASFFGNQHLHLH